MKVLARTFESPADAISSGCEVVTPAYAKQLLERNQVNRRLDEKVVDRYARDMAAGEWLLTGEAIVLDKDGNVVQGQHRLRGCLKANTSFPTLIVRGVETVAQLAMDSGKRRSMGDQLRLLGEKNAADLSSAITYCWMYDNDVLPSRSYTPTRAEAMAWLEENPAVRGSVAIGKRVSANLSLNRTVVSFC